jgi:hypothetical protein
MIHPIQYVRGQTLREGRAARIGRAARAPTTPRPASCSLFGLSSIAAIFLCEMGFRIISGTGIQVFVESVESATAALEGQPVALAAIVASGIGPFLASRPSRAARAARSCTTRPAADGQAGPAQSRAARGLVTTGSPGVTPTRASPPPTCPSRGLFPPTTKRSSEPIPTAPSK